MAAILHSNYDIHTYNKGDTGQFKNLFISIYVPELHKSAICQISP